MTEQALTSPMLRAGDRVRLVSPASAPDEGWLTESIAILESWGLVAEVAPHAMDSLGFMAGADRDRLADLNDAFADPDVRAIVTTRGGAGACRIVDDIDFAAVIADPKPLVGFSDITYLHLSLLHRCSLTSIHGCLAGPTARATVRQLLMTTEPLTLHRDPATASVALEVPGRATGRVIGGNLLAMATSVGVRLPDLSGAILFLEDHRAVGLGTLDRQLTQLVASGSLDGIAGIALGSFECSRDYGDVGGWTVPDIVQHHLGALGVPVLGGLFAGHNLRNADGEDDQSALPLGTEATLDTEAGTLSVGPVVH